MNDQKDFFKLDSSLCIKCSSCARDCFFGALQMGENGFPSFSHPEKCMCCQHCFAVCPTGAITFKGNAPDDSPLVKDLKLPSGEEMENFIRSRRSMRRYLDQDVDRALLERILKALGNSPTGCNARNLKFTCFPDRKAMNALRKKFISVIEKHRNGTKLLPRWLAVPAIQLRRGVSDVFFRGATGLLIISSDKNAPQVTTPDEDVVIACSHFDMLAQANGLGTCWFGFFKHIQEEIPEMLPEIIGIGEKTPFYAILFGYPAMKYKRCVKRDNEASIDWRGENQ
jgi:nitroreductase/NAD-dependent dihydropyrimidine dehydrogenase PreA subunit